MENRPLTVGLTLVLLITSLAIGPLAAASTAQVGDTDTPYTTDADFDQGMLVNLNHDAPNRDQLQLNQQTQPFPFVNVAASGRGTVVRIDANTGDVIGEFRAAPRARLRDPSRTTVDLYGNVWAGNRGESGLIDGVPHGSVVKIGLVVGGIRVDADGTPDPDGPYLAPPFAYNTCVDRDGDGLIKTSRKLHDIRAWPDVTDGVGGNAGIVEDADDECILIYQRLPGAPEIRHVSVDANNDVWVGGNPLDGPRAFHKLDGNTGEILASFDAQVIGCGGYGGLIDGNGIIWSAGGPLLRYDPATGVGKCIGIQTYGVGIDTNGFIWVSGGAPLITKLSPTGAVQPGFPRDTPGAGLSRGVAVTPADNHVWIAMSDDNTVLRLDNDGNLVKIIAAGSGSGPTGVAVDVNGKVWVTNMYYNNVMCIDPSGGEDGLGAVYMTVDLGSYASPYNYSDMTGLVAINSTSPQGTWSVVKDAGAPGTEWGTIVWNTEAQGSEPPGTEIVVEARAAGTEAGLGGETFQAVSNGIPLALAGQFIEVRVTLKTTVKGISPVLSDIRIQAATPTPTPAPTATPTATPTPTPKPTATSTATTTPTPTFPATLLGTTLLKSIYPIVIALAIIIGYILVRRAARRR